MRVLVVDDHEFIRKGIRSLLATEPSLTFCGEAIDGKDAVEKAMALRPDIVVMDISMPNMNGLEATREIKRFLPESGIVILSQHETPEMVRQAFKMGANGYVVKSAIASSLLAAIAKVHQRETFVQSDGLSGTNKNIDAQEILQRSAALERALRESEERLRLAQHVARIGTFEWNIQTGVNRWTPELEAMYGLPPGGFPGSQSAWEQLVHPNDRDEAVRCVERAIKDGSFEGEWRVVWPDGSIHWLLGRASVIKDAAGDPERLVGINMDVTDRKKAEMELQESGRRFREMIDALPAAIYTTDAEGRLTHFNPAAVKFSGRVPEKGTDQWCVSWKMFRADGTPLPHDQCPMAVALKEGRIQDGIEAIAERPDGTRVWFTPYPRPLHDAEGRIIGGINMLVDITQRKQGEQATGLLAAIVDSSDDAIVSKNLNGIITSWNKSAEQLFGYAAKEAIGQHILLVIPPDHRDEEATILERLRRGERVELENATDKLRELSGRLLQTQDEERRRIARELHDGVGQLLVALKMNSSSLTKEKTRLSADACQSLDENAILIEQATQEIRTMSHLLHPPLLDEVGLESALRWYTDGFAERSKISVHLQLAPEFSAGLPRDLALALFRVVQECLTNVHRHSESTSAFVTLDRSLNEITLEVKDKGKGITPEIQSRISSGQSSGVGFRGMRERIRQFGGRLEVCSDEDSTRVVAILPAPDLAAGDEETHIGIQDAEIRTISGYPS